MSKKTSLIIIISVLVIIISLVISIYMPNKNKIEENFDENSETYFLLEKDEKYGITNSKEEVVIEPQYDEIIIPNPNREVFICKNGKESKVINAKNEEIFQKYNNIQAIKLENIISETEQYEKNVLKYEKDGKYGLIDMAGEEIVKPKYDEISSLGYKQGQILIKEKEKYGIIDSQGNTIIKPIFDSIQSDQYYTDQDKYEKSGYIVCETTEDGYRYGYYDYEGSQILDNDYNEIVRIAKVSGTDDIYLIASENGQAGVFVNNNKIIDTKYQSIIYNDDTKNFVVEITGKYGVINNRGVEILPVEYSSIEIKGIYIYTTKEEEQKVFDKEGKEVEIAFDTIIEPTKNSEYYVKSVQNQKYSILNSNFEEISKQEYSYLEYAFDKYFIATNMEGKSGVIDTNENILLNFEYDVVQSIKGENILQVKNFDSAITQIYNNKIEKVLEIENANFQSSDDYIKIYNEKEEYYLDNNGNIIEK